MALETLKDVETTIEIARKKIIDFDCQSPCRETRIAITKLDEALMWLEKRTKDRTKRGVEGTSNQ